MVNETATVRAYQTLFIELIKFILGSTDVYALL